MRFVCGPSGKIELMEGKNPEDLLHRVLVKSLWIRGEQLLFVLNTKFQFSRPVAFKEVGLRGPGV